MPLSFHYVNHFVSIICGLDNGVCHHGGHCWDYYTDTMPYDQAAVTYLKIGTRCLNALQWLDKYQGVPG